jgi:hypothetical protein
MMAAHDPRVPTLVRARLGAHFSDGKAPVSRPSSEWTWRSTRARSGCDRARRSFSGGPVTAAYAKAYLGDSSQMDVEVRPSTRSVTRCLPELRLSEPTIASDWRTDTVFIAVSTC